MSSSSEYVAHKPWLLQHPRVAHSADAVFRARFSDALSQFRHAVNTAANAPAIHYFDATISYSELDRLSDNFASHLILRGIEAGDRVALYLQNVPQFVICLVGAWKAGAIAVSINPMNRARELTLLLKDSGAKVLVMHPDLFEDIARDVLEDFPQVLAITTSALAFQTRNDARVMPAEKHSAAKNAIDLSDLLTPSPTAVTLHQSCEPANPAVIVYTSGTTGVPKGALNTHANIAIDSEIWRAWVDIPDGSPILSIAPLFHITGLVGNVGFAFSLAAPLILSLRFHPHVVAETAVEHNAVFVVGAITAFIAMMNDSAVKPEHFRSLKRVFSGGAPVPAAVAAEFAAKFGLPIRNCYGLTETTSLAVGVPPGSDTPIDANGAFSIGVPVFATDIVIINDDSRPVPPGESGEITIRGPQVIPGYWNRPTETAEALVGGFLRTGDIGYMDEHGWLYIVDRKKDMISASGYKVWPKEIEDVIYTHPAVREVAVVGVAHDYRGETVKAFVSLKAGQTLTQAELISFCAERMAAYKYPRLVEFLGELPKTQTGKILRRELRERQC